MVALLAWVLRHSPDGRCTRAISPTLFRGDARRRRASHTRLLRRTALADARAALARALRMVLPRTNRRSYAREAGIRRSSFAKPRPGSAARCAPIDPRSDAAIDLDPASARANRSARRSAADAGVERRARARRSPLAAC